MSKTALVDTDEPVLAPDVEAEIAKDLEPYKREVKAFEEKAKTLTVTDDITEIVATEFINGCKRLYGEMEDLRDEKVRPMNNTVKGINRAYKPFTNVLDQLWRATDLIKSDYVTKKQQAIDAANRKAIADAAEARRVEEAKAEAARQEAERLRLEAERLVEEENQRVYQAEMDRLAAEKKIQDDEEAVRAAKREGDAKAARAAQKLVDDAKHAEEDRLKKVEEDRLAAIEEQTRLEKAANKQDAKADLAESKATMVTPTIQINDSVGSRTLSDGSSTSTRKTKRWVFSNGLPETSTPCRDDPRFKDIGDEFFEFNPTLMNKMVKAGVKPKGVTVIEDIATTVRK